jgi:hypothetical protein
MNAVYLLKINEGQGISGYLQTNVCYKIDDRNKRPCIQIFKYIRVEKSPRIEGSYLKGTVS